MNSDNNLIDLNIKYNFFNTKFLFYNYYQFNKHNKIPIQYRTPYCILDGIYFNTKELYIKKIKKYKNSNKFVLVLEIEKNNNIINILEQIDKFNINFFNNIKLINNCIKKKRTLKNSYSNTNSRITSNSSINDENNDVFNNEVENTYNDRFNKFNLFKNKPKYYEYKSFLTKNDDKYLIECQIKLEFCQKLLFKLRNHLTFSNKNNKSKEYILCNDIIKSSNIEYFKFFNIEKEWDFTNWNINININIKSNSFIIENDNIIMNWKIYNYSLL
jgi:hypothetical protein